VAGELKATGQSLLTTHTHTRTGNARAHHCMVTGWAMGLTLLCLSNQF